MKIAFPSSEFDEAVAAVCHGAASEEQSRGLNQLLRENPAALDEYILRLELHSRLASDRDLFAPNEPAVPAFATTDGKHTANGWKTWGLAMAACLALVAAALWSLRTFRPAERGVTTSKAVAMLNRTADAQWQQGKEAPKLNAALEPRALRLEAGLAEIIFYSGARLVMEGPAEVQLISQNEAFCKSGRIVAEIPNQARGFRMRTPHALLTDLEGSLGLGLNPDNTEVHALKGAINVMGYAVDEGLAARIDRGGSVRLIEAQPDSFSSPFELQAKSAAAGARRHDQWRSACKRLESDPSLLVHFDFQNVAPSGWQLRNLGKLPADLSGAAIVGCQWTEGRWPEKRALEFQSVSDRVRLTVPGEFQALTLTAWVRVKGLDRKINSLFMSDGFEPGTLHWVIRRDGAVGMTIIGANPRDHQIVASPPVITLDQIGTWQHLAVSVDSTTKRVIHYVNGHPVSEKTLKIAPPFRIGAAEIGNWNGQGFPENDPFMIRNFSGSMDELCVFSRALAAAEIRTLYSQGKPQPEPIAKRAVNHAFNNP